MTSSTTSWLIGSAAECQIVVGAPTVSGRHCRLTWDGSTFWLEDLDSTNGTTVNGERIFTKIRVSPADNIWLGKQTQLPWPDLAELADRVITIGGAADNDVVLDYPMVSGHHARVLIFGDEMLLEDLNSTNGTYLGSRTERITRSAIKNNDTVYLGSFEVLASRLLEPLQPKEAAADVVEESQPETAYVHKRRPSQTVSMVMQALGLACSLLLGWAIYRMLATKDEPLKATAEAAPQLRSSTETLLSQTAGQLQDPHSDPAPADLKPLPEGERDKTATASVAKPVATKPRPPIEEVIAPLERNVVWLTVEPQKGIRYPIGTGWLINPQMVITTAMNILLLQQFHGHGEPIYVFHADASGKFIAIKSLGTHPLFRPNDPAGDVSRHHDLGVVRLETPLSIPGCPLATSSELTSLRHGAEVITIGYSIDQEKQKTPYDLLNAPQRIHTKGTIVGTTSLVTGDTDYPRLELKLDAPPGTEGGPVFNSEGHVIGVLWRAGGAMHAIPADRIDALMKSANSFK